MISGQQGQSTLEWVIGAAVILGTLTSQRDHASNHGSAIQFQPAILGKGWRLMASSA